MKDRMKRRTITRTNSFMKMVFSIVILLCMDSSWMATIIPSSNAFLMDARVSSSTSTTTSTSSNAVALMAFFSSSSKKNEHRVKTQTTTLISTNRKVKKRMMFPSSTITTSRSATPAAANSAVLAAAASNDASSNDSSPSREQTIATAAFNLIKGCVGAGVLSLPAGVAAIGDVPKAIVPASLILCTLGSISAYTFHLLGRLTAVASSESSEDVKVVTSLGQLWDHEVGPSTSWLISLAVMLTCFGTCLCYSIILGDTCKSLAETVGLSGVLTSRRFNVAAIALLGVYPMSCLKSLAALAPVSISGVIGIFVTCIVMAIRALPGGAYSIHSASVATNNYLRTLPAELRPSFGITGLRSPRSLFVVSSMAATAFLVHMSSPEFYQTLKQPTLDRFGRLSIVGFGVTALISAFMMSLGFLTFGGASQGMILNNYSTLDAGATLCRLLMGVSLLGSYGFLANAMKKAFYQIFYKGQEVTDKLHYDTSRFLVGVITLLAVLIKDAGFVVSVTGAILGSALIYVIPPYLFLKSTNRRVDQGILRVTSWLRFEQWWNRGLIGLGIFLAFAGASMSVVNSFFPHLL